jgi:hypothetical protein
MPREIKSTAALAPGDFYEDCAYHPCLCISVNPEADDWTREGAPCLRFNVSGPALRNGESIGVAAFTVVNRSREL